MFLHCILRLGTRKWNLCMSAIVKWFAVAKRHHDQIPSTLQWRHNEHDGDSHHQRLDGLLNRLFRRRSKKTSKLRVTGLFAGNSPVTGEFPTQRASNAKKVSIWWRHHELPAKATCHIQYRLRRAYAVLSILNGSRWYGCIQPRWIPI